jgi:hypothetical protein
MNDGGSFAKLDAAMVFIPRFARVVAKTGVTTDGRISVGFNEHATAARLSKRMCRPEQSDTGPPSSPEIFTECRCEGNVNAAVG